MKVSLGGDVDGIAITSITPKVAGAKAVTFEKGDWTVQYAKAEAGKKANELTTYATTFPHEAGTWYMKSTCTKTGDANGAVIYTKVTVDAAALTGTTVKFQGDEDGEYVDSLTFNDTNLTEKLEFTAPDGTKLVPGASDKDAPEGPTAISSTRRSAVPLPSTRSSPPATTSLRSPAPATTTASAPA